MQCWFVQAEKRKMLMEHETGKMKELEEQYQAELKEWKGQLRPRKQVQQHPHLFIQPYTVTATESPSQLYTQHYPLTATRALRIIPKIMWSIKIHISQLCP